MKYNRPNKKMTKTKIENDIFEIEEETFGKNDFKIIYSVQYKTQEPSWWKRLFRFFVKTKGVLK